jgi:hypothetical protein
VILGDSPFVPVVPPRDFNREETVLPLFGQTAEEKRDEIFEELAFKRLVEKQEAEAAAAAKKRFLLFGLAGVAVGAAVTGTMTAFALSSYRKSDSVLGPAIYAGIGSAVMGTGMVFILSRAVAGQKVDPRVAALAVGARLAS